MQTLEVISTFDYSTLDLAARILVQQCTSEIRGVMRRSAYDAIEIGQKLLEVKAQLGHGHFCAWLQAEFDWSIRTADNYMLVCEKFATVANLDAIAPSALYLLAAPSTPEPARQEALQQAAAGSTVTKAAAKQLIDKHKLTPGDTVTVQAGAMAGQTVTIVESDGIVVQCLAAGAPVAMLTSELVTPNPPAPKSPQTKPHQTSEIIGKLELQLTVANARIEKLEFLLKQTQAYVPNDLHLAIAAMF
jgi:hypothetical protein